MTDDTNKEIAALKAELEKVKASLAPAPDDRAAIGAWRDQMRAASEARASVSGFTRADLEEFERACPTSTMRGIVHDNRAPTGRPGMIPSNQQPPTNVQPVGNRTGWVEPARLSNPPGIAWVDAILEVDSAKQRGEAMIQEAKIKAAEQSK